MRKIRGWFWRSPSERARGQRGATIPEYALILSLIVVGTIGAIQTVDEKSEDQMEETSDCIGKLPNQAGCGVGVEEVPEDPVDPTSDPDYDTIPNSSDNCDFVFNIDQLDTDGDGQGNPCDPTPNGDVDLDNVDDGSDNCPGVFNEIDPGTGLQPDADSDTVGDACDDCPGADDTLNSDGDTVPDCLDNCDFTDNETQLDVNTWEDGDGVGDACETLPQYHVEFSAGSWRPEGGVWSDAAVPPVETCSSSSDTWYCYRARVTVTLGAGGPAVPGITVNVLANPEGSQSNLNRSCTTNASGWCEFAYVRYRDSGSSADFVDFTVTGTSGGTWTWDGDSTPSYQVAHG